MPQKRGGGHNDYNNEEKTVKHTQKPTSAQRTQSPRFYNKTNNSSVSEGACEQTQQPDVVEGKSQLAQATPLTYTGERNKVLVYFTALQTQHDEVLQTTNIFETVEIAFQKKVLGIGSHTAYARLKL